MFTYVHGITWQHVRSAPTFAEAWPNLSRLLEGVKFLAAHNAGFDRRVLETCCQSAGLVPPFLTVGTGSTIGVSVGPSNLALKWAKTLVGIGRRPHSNRSPSSGSLFAFL